MPITVELTGEQLKAAYEAFDMSAMNGILCLAANLRGRGLLDDGQTKFLFDAMSRPLSGSDVADNPAVHLMQDFLNERFAVILNGPGTEI